MKDYRIIIDLAETIEQNNSDLLENFNMEDKMLYTRFLCGNIIIT